MLILPKIPLERSYSYITYTHVLNNYLGTLQIKDATGVTTPYTYCMNSHFVGTISLFCPKRAPHTMKNHEVYRQSILFVYCFDIDLTADLKVCFEIACYRWHSMRCFDFLPK